MGDTISYKQHHILFLFFSLLLSISVTASKAYAAQDTIIVNSTEDSEDFGGDQQVDDLPGPDGLLTLREAVTAANNTSGPQFTAFNIPTSDPNYSPSGFDGMFVIYIENTPGIFLNDDSTTIDGTTQTDFTGDTNPSGHEIHIRTTAPFANINGIEINANDNTVLGLQGLSLFRYSIRIDGHRNAIKNCNLNQGNSAAVYITGSNNVIGSTESGETNHLSSSGNGIWIVGPEANENQIIGNDLTGSQTYGIHIEPDNSYNVIGGPTEAERNIIGDNGHVDENIPDGANVFIEGTHNTLQGNYIGVDESGASALGNIAHGVEITGSFHTIKDNVISGHNYNSQVLNGRTRGIMIRGGQETHDITIQGNLIGTDASGTDAIPNQIGIRVEADLSTYVHDILIGGTGIGEANTIAFNAMDGVAIEKGGGVDAGPTGIQLSANAIYANEELGIDLNDDPSTETYPNSVTPNDEGDTDTGANQVQNFPVIESAVDNGEETVITGTIDTQNPETVIIELFSNDSADASGYGEGHIYEASGNPDANGNFSIPLHSGLSNQYITATATDANGNTSEFSEAAPVDQPSSIEISQNPAPESFKLYSNYPNPFNPSTTFRFDLPERSRVRLSVFDITGQIVATLVNGKKETGTHTIRWQPQDKASGIYFYRLKARSTSGNTSFNATGKMIYSR